MRRRIQQLARGKFEHLKPSLSISVDKIDITAMEGNDISGDFVITSTNHVPMRGIVYSSNPRMECLTPQFEGEEIRIRTSRLFLNVRERDHLCYYCSSSFQSFTGSMAVNSGVEHTDAARTEQAVLKELADLCDGPITDEELEDCRRGLLAGMNGLEDTLGGIETWYYMEVLRGGPVQTPDDARRALLAVTREDVRDILKQFTLSVSCLLTREEGNENG